MKAINYQKIQGNVARLTLVIIFIFSAAWNSFSQVKIPLIKASSEKVVIKDGAHCRVDWKLDPLTKPDTYFVNIPSKKSTVVFKTNQEELTLATEPGKSYDFVVLLNNRDTCYVRISAQLPPDLPSMDSTLQYPIRIPFRLIGSRIFLNGSINKKEVSIQFDLGAGTGVVNRNSSERLDLSFSSFTTVSNTEGVNSERTSLENQLKIGSIDWKGVSLTEVGNMKSHEDVIIGNSFFRNHIIEIDYDKMEFVVHRDLPLKTSVYKKLPVFYEQNRPKFQAVIRHNNRQYDFWFLFDTGRDGTMLLGEDFTGKGNIWSELTPLTVINNRKIIRLDATIADVEFKDIVTNAADPAKPNGRSSLFGNQILNHFNVILDNKAGFLYLKPNGRTKEPYSNYESYLNQIPSSIKKN
ncbi:hypothetical protein [Sphingobacterium sp.]|uniref:retroviral-like aspartic protease family protein n=1 Tax=Sphingobacterium sp. TaxID=341027 RepID=UPI0031E1D27A